MRAHYVRAVRAAKDRGLTQEQAAATAGIKQHYISKFKTAPNYGPAIELFIRAIEGLGISPSRFFAELEGRQPPPDDHAVPAVLDAPTRLDRAFIVNAVIDTLQRGVAAPSRTAQRRRRKKH